MSARGAPRVVAAAVATLAFTGVSRVASPTEARAPRQPSDELTLELTEPAFAVAANASWRPVFTVSGTVPGLIPPTTTTTTTTTTPPRGANRPRPPATVPDPGVDATVRVVLYRSIDNRGELTEAVAGEPPNEIDSVDLPVAGALQAQGEVTTLTVDAPTTTEPFAVGALSMRLPGLYPIGVELRVDGRVAAEHFTFVERLPVDAEPSLPINVAVLATTPDPGPAPTASELVAGRRDLEAIAELASNAAGPVTVVIPPVLVADLPPDSGLGTTLAEALRGDEVLPLPANQLDPSSAVAIDASEAFTRELREGEDVLAAALPSAPTRRSAWVVTSPISAAAAAELRNLGFRLLVLDGETYAGLDGNIGGYQDPSLAAEIDVGDGFTLPAVVVSPSGRLLDPEYVRSADLAPTDAAVQLLAEVMTIRHELGTNVRRSVVLAPPAFGVPDADVVAAFTSLVPSVPGVELAPLSALPGATDTMIVDNEPVVLTLPDVAGPELEDRARRIALTRLSAESAASMMLDDSRASAWRAELDTLLSTGLDDATVDAALARIASEANDVRASVSAPTSFTFTLTGRESVLRLNIRNDATEPRVVVVRARSPKLTFPDGDKQVELAPSTNTEVELPVVARSNGTSSVEVELLTPSLEQTVDGPVVLTARVNALTGLGQVITGGAVLVLVSWWFGHIRRRRRIRLNHAAQRPEPGPVLDVSPDAAEALAGSHAGTAAAGSVPEP
jgi:uncharacterized membrane protein